MPGTFDPLIIGHLFHEQREPWAKLIDTYLETILQAVYFLARTALAHACDKTTLEGLSKHFIYTRLENLARNLRNKVTELLKPHETSHPITYNHYLTDNVQKAQSKRRAHEVKKSLMNLFGEDFIIQWRVNTPIDINVLVNTLVTKTEADMNNYASSIATDFMEAYYKVSKINKPYVLQSDSNRWH